MTPLPLLGPEGQDALAQARHRHWQAAIAELELIALLLEAGWRWRQVAVLLELDSGLAAQHHHRRLQRRVRLSAAS